MARQIRIRSRYRNTHAKFVQKNKPKNLRTQLYLSTETLFPQKVYRKLAGKAAVALSQIGNLSSSIGNKQLHNTIMRL